MDKGKIINRALTTDTSIKFSFLTKFPGANTLTEKDIANNNNKIKYGVIFFLSFRNK